MGSTNLLSLFFLLFLTVNQVPTSSTDLYDYSRLSISLSLTEAREFSLMVKEKLFRPSLSLSTLAIRALQDCHLLSTLNIDFLQSTQKTLNSSGNLHQPQAEEARTLLSALLTNQETCLEGLRLAASDWPSTSDLAAAIAANAKLFSLSLSLLSRAWKKQRSDNKVNDIYLSRAQLILESSYTNSSVIVRDSVVVSKTDQGNFTTITDAVNSAPSNTDSSGGYFIIYVMAGIYDEYVEVPPDKRYIMMIGEGIDRTVLTGNRNVVDGWTTFNSATLAVVGQGFVAVNITVRNTAGPAKQQAVAVRNGADQSAFYQCRFEGYQDTLYAHSLRQFYRDCDIYGTIDFIFGNAAVVFQGCNLYPRLPIKGQANMVTAQGRTDPNQNTGTSIQWCSIVGTPDLVENGTGVRTYLGRPWQMYSQTVVMESYLDGVIDPEGWAKWDGNFALSTLFYGEYNNEGAGANTSRRVDWPGFHVMTGNEAVNFTVSVLLSGDEWLPATGVPFSNGLM